MAVKKFMKIQQTVTNERSGIHSISMKNKIDL